MTNLQQFKELLSSAKNNTDEILNKINEAKTYTKPVYVSHSLSHSGDGYNTSIISSDAHWFHGFHVDFGGCKTLLDIERTISREEEEVEYVHSTVGDEWVGK